jgi:pimeloyl-ACP methyl ester carboxylesterase
VWFSKLKSRGIEPEFIELDNQRIIDVLSYGSGSPHIWLHSGFRGRIGISNLIKTVERELQKRNLTIRQFIPHLSGFGQSSATISPGANPFEMAEDIIKYIEQQNLADIRLIGYSLGANVGSIVSNRIPERIQSLVLLGTAIEGSDLNVYRELHTKYSNEDWEGIVNTIAVKLVGDNNRDQYLKMMPLVKKQVSSERFERDLVRLLDMKTRLDVFPEIEKLVVPTLMISGLQDPFVPRPERRDLLDSKSNIQSKFLEGVGHNEVVFPRQVNLIDDILEFWGY